MSSDNVKIACERSGGVVDKIWYVIAGGHRSGPYDYHTARKIAAKYYGARIERVVIKK